MDSVLVLKSEHPSLYHEVVSMTHRKWMCDLMSEHDREWEKRLEQRHEAILPDLARHLDVFSGWGMAYSTTKEIDDYFLEWGQVYLRRMWSQDLVGLEDPFEGNQFRDYLGVLAALAGRAQKHICFASMLKQQHPHLDLRNLLTTFAPYDSFVVLLSDHLDADALQIERLLRSLTLDPTNRDAHTLSAETAWAPIVRCSESTLLLPLYGLEINPFLFLLRDLRTRHPEAWFTAANNREKRWLIELRTLFGSERWITIDSPKLWEAGRTVTDIDFVAYDRENNELGLFQLKWQQPVGMDNRTRRSAGKNLVTEGNKWVVSVHNWLQTHGDEEVSRRLGIITKPRIRVVLFVIARYNVLFSGFDARDNRACWADWNHFVKVRTEHPIGSLLRLAEELNTQIQTILTSSKHESYAFAIMDLAVILNPTSEPDAKESE
jgi:hypothetical protein